MGNDFYFKIFDKAAKAGIYNSVDVSDEVREHLKHIGADKYKSDNVFNLSDDLLGALQAKDYFHYLNILPEKISPIPDNWMELIKVILTLHPEGLLFYYQQLQIKELIKSNKIGKRFIIATITLSIASFFISLGTFIKTLIDDRKQDMPQQKVQSHCLNKELKQQKDILNQKPYLPDSSHK